MHFLPLRLGQFAEDGLEKFCAVGCLVQCVVRFFCASYFPRRQKGLPVMLKASPFTLNPLSKTTSSIVVEFCGASLAES